MNYILNESEMFADINEGTAIVINSQTGIYYGMNGFGTSVLHPCVQVLEGGVAAPFIEHEGVPAITAADAEAQVSC